MNASGPVHASCCNKDHCNVDYCTSEGRVKVSREDLLNGKDQYI